MTRHRCAAVLVIAAAAALAGGCDQDKRIAQLQQQVATLDVDLQRCRSELRLRTEQVRQFDEQVARLNRFPPQRWELIPHTDRIEIGRYSGLRRGRPQLESPATQPARQPPADVFARVYIAAVDQLGATIRPVGPIRICLFDLSSPTPQSMGCHDFTAEQAANAYRSAMGTNAYTFDLPLPRNPPPEGVTVRVELIDWLTGRKLTAQGRLTLPNN